METDNRFDEIRPYHDNEVKEVLQRLSNSVGLRQMLKNLKTDEEIEAEFSTLSSIDSIKDFQQKHIAPYVDHIISKTIDKLTVSGLENIEKGKSYLFLGNHRDIILDSALLNHILSNKGFPTTEIGLGDNLLIFDWIKDLVKLNKGFIVKRGLKGRKMLETSLLMSEYIFQKINKNTSSLWLAQRPGRTKDGNDITHPALIKMLLLYNRKKPIETINSLNICPVTISYENEPCEKSKIMTSLYAEKEIIYEKIPEEDLKSMGHGILFNKGRVHMHLNGALKINPKNFKSDINKNDFAEYTAKRIDKKIYKGYCFFQKNYIAYDLYTRTNRFLNEGKYDLSQRAVFQQETIEITKKLNSDEELLSKIYTKMYAYPLLNMLCER